MLGIVGGEGVVKSNPWASIESDSCICAGEELGGTGDTDKGSCDGLVGSLILLPVVSVSGILVEVESGWRSVTLSCPRKHMLYCHLPLCRIDEPTGVVVRLIAQEKQWFGLHIKLMALWGVDIHLQSEWN